MPLNDIQLTSRNLTDLYTRSLIQEPAPVKLKEEIKGMATPPTAEEWPSLGNNQKNILIVVTHTTIVHLPDDELDFLVKILMACKLGLNDVAIINYHNYQQATTKILLEKFNPKNVLLFGIDPISFGLPAGFPPFQIQQLAATGYLYAPPLLQLVEDKNLKAQLWTCLKRIFGI